MKNLGAKKVGEVTHCRKVEGDLQTDKFTLKIPFGLLSGEGLDLLDYWEVDNFEYAYIDRDQGCIVCVATHEIALPEGYEPEEI